MFYQDYILLIYSFRKLTSNNDLFSEKALRLHLLLMKQIVWKLVCVAIMIDKDLFNEKKIQSFRSSFFWKKRIVAPMVHCGTHTWSFKIASQRADHPHHGLITQLKEQSLPDSTGICRGGVCNINFLKTLTKFKIQRLNYCDRRLSFIWHASQRCEWLSAGLLGYSNIQTIPWLPSFLRSLHSGCNVLFLIRTLGVYINRFL